jgi:hypothetical protein
MSELRMN